MIKISIIMPIYNSINCLEKTITSVINQSLKEIEIICINIKSTDNSAQILESLSKKYKCIKIINQKNQGISKAMNYGLNEAKGEYISFLYANDLFIDEESLEILYTIANKNNANIICGNLKKLNSDRILLDDPNCSENNHNFNEYFTIEPDDYEVPLAFYKNIYKKSFLNENNIRFKDLIKCQGVVFLADVLTNVDIVYSVPIDFYARRFPDSQNYYSKIDSPLKKLHYILHFKDTFDIFEDNNLYKLSEHYKPKFIKYLNYSISTKSLDIYELVMKVFGKNNNYFVNFQDEYDYFRVFHILNKVMRRSNTNYFFEAQEEISNIDIFNNKLLPKKLVDNVKLLNYCSSFEEYKNQYLKFNLDNIKQENEDLNKKNKQFLEKLKYMKKLLNRKFNLFIIKYNNLPNESKTKYYYDLKDDFISIKNNAYYNDLFENFNEFNKEFFENIIKSQSFEEFNIFFANTKLKNQNKKLEKKLNKLVKENKKIADSPCWKEQNILINKNSELNSINKNLKIKFLKMNKKHLENS